MGKKRKNKILIIDDDRIFMEPIKIFLSESGYDVVTATSPITGEKILSDTRFDLVLIDLIMPEKSGEQVIKGLRVNKKTRDIPVILMSSSNTLAEAAQRVKADTYIEKPFSINKLEKLISRFVTS